MLVKVVRDDVRPCHRGGEVQVHQRVAWVPSKDRVGLVEVTVGLDVKRLAPVQEQACL